jgi:hypothetical protein
MSLDYHLVDPLWGMMKRMSSNLMCLMAVDQEVLAEKLDKKSQILPTACHQSLQPSMTSKAIIIPK